MRTKILAVLAGAATLCMGARAGSAGLDSRPDAVPTSGIDDRTRLPLGEPELGVIDGSKSQPIAVPGRARPGTRRRGAGHRVLRPAAEPRDVGNNSDANGGSSTTVTPPVPFTH